MSLRSKPVPPRVERDSVAVAAAPASGSPAAERSPSRLSETFRALRYRDYRLLWTGQLGHSASMWMEQVIRPVLVYELTQSAKAVAWIVAMRMIPVLLFGVLAGAVADRFDRKKVLFCTQSTTCAMHAVLAVLVISGRVELWHVYATALVAGAALAFNGPARQSLIPRLVPREDLMNAVALNTTAMNIMRIGGGAMAGVLLIVFNIGEVYALNAVIYIGVIIATQSIRIPKEPPRENRGSLFSDLGEGFVYVSKHRTVGGLILLALILFVFGMPYQQVFVPLIAYRVFELDRSWVGIMLSCTGVGALAGSLFVASRTDYKRPGFALAVNLLVFGGALVALGLSPWLPLTLFLLAVAGSMTVSFMAVMNTLILSATPQELHGRVMSLLSLDRGIIPLGALLAGLLADEFSTGIGMMSMGSIVIVLSIPAIIFLVPSLNTIRLQPGLRRRGHGGGGHGGY